MKMLRYKVLGAKDLKSGEISLNGTCIGLHSFVQYFIVDYGLRLT